MSAFQEWYRNSPEAAEIRAYLAEHDTDARLYLMARRLFDAGRGVEAKDTALRMHAAMESPAGKELQ